MSGRDGEAVSQCEDCGSAGAKKVPLEDLHLCEGCYLGVLEA